MKAGKKALRVFLATAVSLGFCAGDCRAETGEEYVVWGQGRGITPETLGSQEDVFAPYDSGFSLESGEPSAEIQDCYQTKGGRQVFGDPVSGTYVASTGVVLQEYTRGMIFSSEYGTYGVTLPLLNLYLASGGLESLGAPLGEQTRTDGGLSQSFEKGTVSGGEEVRIAPDTLAVRRDNVYYFKYSISGGEADQVVGYGRPGDQVLVGDWNGDWQDTLCVRRDNLYYIQNSFHGGEADVVVAYGKPGDTVLAGDWDGDGVDTLCVRRDNLYYIKNSLSGGEADAVLAYGKASDTVYVGNWQGADRGEKLETGEASDLSFNQSRGFQYSRLLQGFAGNAVNSVSFRKNAVTSWEDSQGNLLQYCAWYDYAGNLVLAKRINQGDWEYSWTGFQGDITDAHNAISIAVDGRGYLHMAWSRHAGALNYAVSDQPGSLRLRRTGMIGTGEDQVTYPEFYMQPSGDLFFLYRSGSSGDGDLVLNHYDSARRRWTRLQDNLISGEGERSPYWQACVDSAGRLHISWVWRETEDVSTNYNMSYAVSCDASGETFENSRGEACALPLTEDRAETICQIPQGSALINQTSMTVDDKDLPYIISYWRVDGVVQYNILRDTGSQWIIYNTDIRTTDFQLSGGGTRQLPCARPQILVRGAGEEAELLVFFRDEERGSRASLARLTVNGREIFTEEMIDLTGESLEEWEPVLDLTLWKEQGRIQVFLQREHYQPDGTGGSSLSEYIYVADVTKFLNN